MSTKLFGAEEISILQQNPYTKSVDSRNLFTTKEFKEEFLKQYLRGDKAPREIVSDLGYAPAILGLNRIVGIRNHIVQAYKAGEEFVDGGYRGTAKILQGTNIDSGVRKKESSQITAPLRITMDCAFCSLLLKRDKRMSSPPTDTAIKTSENDESITTVSVPPNDFLRFTEAEIVIELDPDQWIDVSGMVEIRGTAECE